MAQDFHIKPSLPLLMVRILENQNTASVRFTSIQFVSFRFNLAYFWNKLSSLRFNLLSSWKCRLQFALILSIVWNKQSLLRFDLSYIWNKQRSLRFNLLKFLNMQSSIRFVLSFICNKRSLLRYDLSYIWNKQRSIRFDLFKGTQEWEFF